MSEKIKASRPTEGDALYHIRVKPGDIPDYTILPGAPERTDKIIQDWDDYEDVAYYREYKTVKGNYKGTPIAATSTGIGCPSAEIAIHELNEVGVHTGIRVGTTGCIVPEFDLGDLIIPVAAVKKDGASHWYTEPEYPSFADPDVVSALTEACERLGYRYGYGLVYTVGSFYIGQGRPISEDCFWPSWAENIIPDLQQSKVTNIDMDTAGQFTVGYLHGMRMGAILSVISNRV